MSILKELEKIITESYKPKQKEVIKEEWEMEPDSEEESYIVKFDNQEICNVDIIRNSTDKSEDIEIAQQKPEDFTVYISDIKDQKKAEEYKDKLETLGFENISMEDAVVQEPELASVVDESAKNQDVATMFIKDEFPKDKLPIWGSKNLKITKVSNGWTLVNYFTPILFRNSEGKVYFNTEKYSVSTSTIQNKIKEVLKQNDVKFEDVSEEKMSDLIEA